MYHATSSKSRSVTSFCMSGTCPLHKDDTHQFIPVHSIMAQEKQVPLPISLLGVPVGFAGYEPKASPWVTSLLLPMALDRRRRQLGGESADEKLDRLIQMEER